MANGGGSLPLVDLAYLSSAKALAQLAGCTHLGQKLAYIRDDPNLAYI